MRRDLLAAVVVLSGFPCAAAPEKPFVEIGVLSCTLGEVNSPSSVVAARPTREALCSFKSKSGLEETYAGQIEGVSISPDVRATLIWTVKSTSGATPEPGSLAQAYVVDAAASAELDPPVVGATNANLILQSMADKPEGAASSMNKPPPRGFVVLAIELTLKAASV